MLKPSMSSVPLREFARNGPTDSNGSSVTSTAPPGGRSDAPPPPKDERGRCIACNGTGYTKWDVDRAVVTYCTCPMGKDLRHADERVARVAKTNQSADCRN